MPIVGQRHRMTIDGVGAIVRLGYQRAAELGAWHVDGDSFSAQVIAFDGFRITQAPLVLEIPNRTGAPIIRPLADVRIQRGELVARLQPKPKT